MVVEKQEVFSYAACGMPYVLSGDIMEADALRRTGDGVLRDTEYFSDVKGVEVLAEWEAVAVDSSAKRLRIRSGDDEKELEWDELVLATGAGPKRLPEQPGHGRVRSFHEFQDVTLLHSGLVKGEVRSVIVIGAGLVGCELAEAFGALWGAQVTLIEAKPIPLPELLDVETGGIVAQALADNDVQLLTGALVERIDADDEGVRVTVKGNQLEADLAVVAIGVKPSVRLAEDGGVAIGPTGAIAVDERMATSMPHVWAIGDCVEVRHRVTGEPCLFPLGSLANRQGRALANILAGREDRFPPIAGAVAVKVFDCNVAAVGLTREKAEQRFDDVRSVCVSAQDRPHYWPEAKNIALELVYRSDSRRLLGVQVVGEGDVTKRVDVATQLLLSDSTLEDVSHLEHAYAPPYSPALDPLAVTAFAAQNFEEGIVAASPDEPLGQRKVLDVRHPEEREARPIADLPTTAIPVAEIRRRLDELEGGPWLVVCERGTRSAETVRVLEAHGIPAQYLGGGVRWMILSGKATEKAG
jgi:NADPH-dependent 2,4-dienoyl-CoA reductase/sulfur reductase-like enzyme/rhodanese-related sulfurtransferase